MASTSSGKKTRIRLTLNEKLEIIKLSEKGMSNTDIGRMLGLARQSVSTIVNDKAKYLREVKSATPVNTKTIRKRDSLIADMEKLLNIWIEDQTSHHVPLGQACIQNKALSLFNSMKADRGDDAIEETFKASQGWFFRFKERSALYNLVGQGEAASAVKEAADNFPQLLAEIIKEGGYRNEQIFNVNETALYWKKMPSRIYIAKREKSMPGLKMAKDRLTLLLGANAAGDCKLKPMMINRTENPRALMKYAKASLPVFYKSNLKAWMTAELFTTWFTEYFKPAVQNYCKENKIPFNILLLIDTAPAHPDALVGMFKEINVCFIPPNTALIQPMDQGVIRSFKSYYARRIFALGITYLDRNTEDISSKENKLIKFWTSFTILDCIKIIRDSWAEVTEQNLRGVWKKLIPTLMDDFEEFDDPVEDVTQDIVDMARQLELQVEPEDVTELIDSHDQPLAEEDLLYIENLTKQEESQTDESPAISREITIPELENALIFAENTMAAFEKIDPNFERSSKVNAVITNAIACYKQLLLGKKRQTSLLSFFDRAPSQVSTETSGLPSTSEVSLTTSLAPSAKRSRLSVDSDDEDSPASIVRSDEEVASLK